MDIVFLAWAFVAFLNIGLMAIYFLYIRRKALKGEYNLKTDETYRPNATLLIPTYNEERVIRRKLENVSMVNYPKNKLEVIVIDSASADNTASIVKDFAESNPQLNLRIIQEQQRKGKARALNYGLEHVNGEVIVISDAECQWPPNALKNTVKYLADPSVGAVTGIHIISNAKQTEATQMEQTYRSVTRILRVGESKLYSTPIFEGELAAFKRSCLERFDEDVGADDIDAALSVINRGYRAIAVSDAEFYEPTPFSWREKFRQKIRRGQHVIQAFVKNRKMLFQKPTPFHKIIFPMEMYLYVLNPLIFIVFIVLSFLIVLRYPYIILLAATMLIPQVRKATIAHIVNNFIMIKALLNEASRKKQLVWEKIRETRI